MKNKEIAKQNITRYSPSPDVGLSDALVMQRKQENLVNTVKTNYSKSYFNILANNFFTFFNLLGLIVTLALIYIKAPLSNFFFVLVYIANIAIGVIQEIRAKKCIEKLCLISNKTVEVLRDGKTQNVSPDQIVLDDVILLKLGNQIPTDSIILEGDVEVNESLLTGESIPIKKTVGDFLYAGSFISCGNCKVKAEKIGKDNYASSIAEKAKKYKKPNSELMNSLKIIIKTIGFIIVPIAIAHILRSTLFLSSSISDAISGTSTLIIGMIPSGMFLLTSLALATGILKLSAHQTLVQDLYSLEMLARVDTICFDKTGTITDGNMTVNSVIPLLNYTEDNIKNIFKDLLGALSSSNQTSKALLDYFGKNTAQVKAVLPFNSERKLSAVTFKNGETFSFGAPEFVLTKRQYSFISDVIDEYAKQGSRVIVLANSRKEIVEDKLPDDFSPIAIICLLDNVRKDATKTVKWFKENEVTIKVISGDNPVTVSEVSKRVGIDNADKYISLDGLTEKEVIEAANRYTVFGRVSPEQKAILVNALKKSGHTVAMTGDGVNDILAMKEADCAVSVASGSEAARNVSHIVLMNNKFSSMPKVVLEGRRVINNVEGSSSLYLMKTVFTMIFSILTLCLPYMKAYPFKLPQMIMLEVFVIGLPSFFLSFQPNDDRVKGRFIERVLNKTLPSAILMILSVVIVEIIKLTVGEFSDEIYITMEVFALTYAGIISLFNLCTPLNKYRTILFSLCFLFIIVISGYAVMNGLTALELLPLTPLKEYWHAILINVAIIILDIPLLLLLKKVCGKIKIKKRENALNKIDVKEKNGF